MKSVFLTMILVFGMVTSVISAEALHEKLEGAWKSNSVTVNFDWKNGEYSGVSMGTAFTRKLTLVKEFANVVIFKSDEAQVTVQFQDDGGILLTKEGGIPVKLTRAK